jgi:putative Mg2+ transporter-C (MgtC) family protein
MNPMTASLHWTDAVLRLALTVLAGMLLGYNRTEHGKAAGMRTTVLVCVAASVAMLQVNQLLTLSGRTSDSFVMNDLMRLPLGILTGVGFIGGGAILRRGNLITGVTTAATLWLVTVIGLCLGGGQIALGLAATLLGLFALWVLKWAEAVLPRERYSRISIDSAADGPDETTLRRRIEASGLSIVACRVSLDVSSKLRGFVFDIRDIGRIADTGPPGVVEALATEPGIMKIQWRGPL